MSDQFKALILNQEGDSFTREVKSIDKSFLKHGDVTIKVEYSGLNYKDSLILKNGARVVSVMKINNVNDRGSIIHKMYEIDSGEKNKPIYVTGSHLVYDPTIKQFVAVDNLRGPKPSRVSEKHCPVLSCLITTNHTIPIGEWIFHDWEDNNGSSSKSLE